MFHDPAMTYLLPPNGRPSRQVLPTDRICMPAQQTHNQTDGSPILRARPGDQLALRYQENGHITLPENNPPGKPSPGMISMYGTNESSAKDTLLNIHNVWDASGLAGDGRGRLLGKSNFDDGRCYQINGGPISRKRQMEFPHVADPVQGLNLWCQSNITLPESLAAGTLYTVYWVWDWPTLGLTPSSAHLAELYTTCVDIIIS